MKGVDIVRVWYNGKNKSLGTFDNPEQASEVREKFAQEIHGEFYRPILIIAILPSITKT